MEQKLKVIRVPNYNGSRIIITVNMWVPNEDNWVNIWSTSTDDKKDSERAKRRGLDMSKDEDIIELFETR